MNVSDLTTVESGIGKYIAYLDVYLIPKFQDILNKRFPTGVQFSEKLLEFPVKFANSIQRNILLIIA